MIRNYLMTALRKFTRKRMTRIINLVGLATGIACCLVIYAMLKQEVSYDTVQKKAHRIFRIVTPAKESTYIDEDEALHDNFSSLKKASGSCLE